MKHSVIALFILCATVLLSACGTSKVGVGQQTKVENTQKKAPASSAEFVKMVNNNKVDAQNIVADLDFSGFVNDKKVSMALPGSLHMRKDKMIRIQIFVPVLGSEIGRLEFTPTYVLIIDRMHKQYLKEDYTNASFLKQNGIDFYSLQSLFWNKLLVPGTRSVSDADAAKFTANLKGTGDDVKVSLNSGKLSFVWDVDRESGLISEANAVYNSQNHGKSALNWKYSDFQTVGNKQFPGREEFSLSGKTKKVTILLDMDDIETTSDWNLNTEISKKYKKVKASDILSKLFNK